MDHFDIEPALAQKMLKHHQIFMGLPNSDVIRPVVSRIDIDKVTAGALDY
jgi:hypothetical protein